MLRMIAILLASKDSVCENVLALHIGNFTRRQKRNEWLY